MTKCIASPLSRQNIRDMAYFIRKIAGQENVLCFDIVHFLDVILPRIDPEFTLIIDLAALKNDLNLGTNSSSVPYSGYAISGDSYVHKNNVGVCELGLIVVGVPLQSVSTFLVAFTPEGFRPSTIKCATALATITGGAQNNQITMQAYLYPNGDIKVVTPTTSGLYDIFLNASYLL